MNAKNLLIGEAYNLCGELRKEMKNSTHPESYKRVLEILGEERLQYAVHNKRGSIDKISEYTEKIQDCLDQIDAYEEKMLKELLKNLNGDGVNK